MHLSKAVSLLLAVVGLASPALGAQGGQAGRFPVQSLSGPVGPGQVWLLPVGGGRIRKATIQSAVDAATEGDTVLLGEGRFSGAGNRDVHLEGKNLTIRSTVGRARTLIDCDGRGRAFHFEGSSVTEATRLVGVTIVNGDALEGGGILCDEGSTPQIEDCTLAWCRAAAGGGIHYAPDPAASSVGPGSLRGCSFLGNTAGSGGGGFVGAVRIERCLFTDNEAVSGAGLYCTKPFTTVRDCVVVHNRAGAGSGFPAGLGGGVAVAANHALIQGCTIVGNSSDHSGGGLAFYADLAGVVANGILWGNAAPIAGSQVVSGSFSGAAAPDIRYCDVEGGKAGIGTSVVGGGILRSPTTFRLLDQDPEFEGPGDYRLSSRSPCIGRGDPAFVPAANQGDYYGQPRKRGGRVDVGADEYWEGMTASTVWPARAGEINSLSVEGARPRDTMFLFAGAKQGLASLGFPACPGLSLEIDDPDLAGLFAAGPAGKGQWSQLVPRALAGTTLFLQVVAFDPSLPTFGCVVGNLVTVSYP